MRRRLLVLAVSLLALGSTVGAAVAAPADDARAAADRFFGAVSSADVNTVCGLLSKRILVLVGGPGACVQGLAEGFDDALGQEMSSEATVEADSLGLTPLNLREAYDVARALALARGGYVTKETGLAQLVRDLHTLEPGLTFSIGAGPKAARGKPETHIVVDRRTSKQRLILYAEADNGTILRLKAHGTKRYSLDRAGKGIPAKQRAPAPREESDAPGLDEFSFAIVSLMLLDNANAYVNFTLHYEDKTVPLVLSMKLEDGAWKVDDLLIPVISVLEAGGGLSD